MTDIMDIIQGAADQVKIRNSLADPNTSPLLFIEKQKAPVGDEDEPYEVKMVGENGEQIDDAIEAGFNQD
jgi:hypothetical protein